MSRAHDAQVEFALREALLTVERHRESCSCSVPWTPDERRGIVSEDPMARKRRTFTDEYKAEAVALVLDRRLTINQVADDLDLTRSSLGNW